jgi:hypothetical protein
VPKEYVRTKYTERYFELTHEATEQEATLAAIKNGTYAFVGSFNIHIVINEKSE